MKPVQKALWYVESHLRDEVSLDAISEICGVSPYYMTRAFTAAFGVPLMRYVRCRRLSEAARALAAGAGSILEVALDAGYGSHEAFTRAFRDQFGVAPEQVRARGKVEGLELLEAIIMGIEPDVNIETPRIETLPSVRFAGITRRYDCRSPGGIPDQWQSFGPMIPGFPGVASDAAFGVCYNFDQEGFFDYMTAVMVNGKAPLPEDCTQLEIPAATYAVFAHRGHIAGIRGTISAIWSSYVPKSGLKPTNGPTFERYGPEFNPITGLGGLEIWIQIEA